MIKPGVALVTGATSGFGRSIALLLAENGFTVVACGRRLEKLKELQAHKNIHTFELDVTDTKKIFELQSELKSKNLEPSVLVNNAGLALGLEPADKANLDDWHRMVDTNISGLMSVTRAFLPAMRTANHGYVINIGSIAGNWPYPGANVYGATKAFVSQFSKNLKADLLGTNIRVTCLEPGMAKTEFSDVRFKGNITQADDVYKGTLPLLGDDIAAIVLWLLSLPEHVNVNTMEVMPTCQAWGGLAVARDL